VFPGAGGVTALYLLAESHLTIHTFPETGAATLNAYCCRPRAAAPWRALFGELLGAREVTATEHARGPSRTDRFRSAAQQGSESPCGEGPPEGGRT
jgi:S-adenosylmethionine/arginine decarboxylase-like enzyme